MDKGDNEVIAAVTSWIKEIIYIILFASFLEFLLPNGQMRKFIRVIIGLFIILAILSPVIDLMKGKQMDQLSVQSVMSGKDSKASEATNKIGVNQEQLVSDLYRQQLAKQIRSVAVTVEGVSDAQVVVDLDQSVNGPGGIGTIHKVFITLQQGRLSSIAPVVLDGTKSAGDAPDDQVKSKVTRMVAELYQLSPQKVIVQ